MRIYIKEVLPSASEGEPWAEMVGSVFETNEAVAKVLEESALRQPGCQVGYIVLRREVTAVLKSDGKNAAAAYWEREGRTAPLIEIPRNICEVLED